VRVRRSRRHGLLAPLRAIAKFVSDLTPAEARRIERCPRCGIFFYGRTNQAYCSPNCRSRHWQAENPEDVKFSERKRNEKRKEERRARRERRELEQVSKIPDQITTTAKGPPRLPGAAKRKER